MAEKKFLDQGGVSHLWSKIKGYLDDRFGTGTYNNTGDITNVGGHIANAGVIMCTGAITVNDFSIIDIGSPMTTKPSSGFLPARLKYEISAVHGIAVVHKGDDYPDGTKGYSIYNGYTEPVTFTSMMFSGSSSSGSLSVGYATLQPNENVNYETNTPVADMHPLLIFW